MNMFVRIIITYLIREFIFNKPTLAPFPQKSYLTSGTWVVALLLCDAPADAPAANGVADDEADSAWRYKQQENLRQPFPLLAHSAHDVVFRGIVKQSITRTYQQLYSRFGTSFILSILVAL